ncbi:hypothetical protein BKA70DRAFT_1253877 [Coprinopsis sp. MPI-PUGE-AT-0042]|nr:hypothetical protein BKA70DRAFT_1253877 [Coprinopsis sp. MPI-PUGE-AT-0042]
MAAVNGKGSDHKGSAQVHRGGSDVERSPGFQAAGESRNRDEVRNRESRHAMAQEQGIQSQETVKQMHDPEEHEHYADPQTSVRSVSPVRRHGRVDRLRDYQGMIHAGYAVMEMNPDRRQRQRITVEESEVDEQQGEGVGVGCLDGLKPEIKRLFGCGNRNKDQTRKRQGSSAQNSARTDNGRHTTRVAHDGVVPPRYPDRGAYPPRNDDRRWQGGSDHRPPFSIGHYAHGIAQGPGSGDLPSSHAGSRSADVTASPSTFSAAETVNISGGHFFNANTFIGPPPPPI